MDFENKKIVLSKHVILVEASLFKSTISQSMERLNTKDASKRVEVDATPLSQVSLVSVGISPDVTPGGNHIVVIDIE